LLFQTLDDKKHCVGIYSDGKLIYDSLPSGISHTWNYASFLKDREIQYAKIYCGGKSLDEVCPEALKPRWEAVNNRLVAFYKSFNTARVSLNENCFYDLIPERDIMDWCVVKNQISRYVFENYKKPENYDYLVELSSVLSDIKYRKLNLDLSFLKPYKNKHVKLKKTLRSSQPYCKFNMWGTKTGRLTTIRSGFPILTLDKTMRSIIKPRNDCFVELDFNAAELRTLLALQNKKQPNEDIHEWNVKNVFNNRLSRDEAKKKIFAWLYNPESHDSLCEHAYGRDSVVQKYFTQGQVTTFWNKVIPSEKRTALNYIIQSTCAENVLRQMIKLSNYLKGYKTHVAFPIHDSVVLDLSYEEKEKLPELVDIFSNTALGKMRVNVSVGKDFGSLKKLEF
tara:strand:+ start:1181 stop:2362 length:1182 start_codon:yes stop_codon:yes gene_type:complete